MLHGQSFMSAYRKILVAVDGSRPPLGASEAIRLARGERAQPDRARTHGRRDLRRLVLGSDAEQVVRAAPVPVLLVREL